MIDLYYFPTPNTWKVAIMLEECGLPYRVVPIDISKGDQFAPSFLSISPNNRIPAILDHDAGVPQSVFESGAILLYLAEKTGRFLASDGPARVAGLEWLFWQMGGLGPMAGQAGFFRRYAPQEHFGVERYTKEVTRLYGVMERRLAGRDWLAGVYGIADMACWGWLWFHPAHGQTLSDFPNISRWYFSMAERPAVQRARMVGMDTVSDEVRTMFQGPYYQQAATFAADKTLPPSAPR